MGWKVKKSTMHDEGRNHEDESVRQEEAGALNADDAQEADAGAGAVSSAKEGDMETLKKQLAEAREEAEKKSKELAELKDLMQRRQADFENYKKRVIKNQEETRKLAIKDVALDIISINDDLLRAIEASSSVKEGESLEQAHASFVDGVKMISKTIEETLRKYGVEEIDHLGRPFDPQYNEAVEIVTSDAVKEETVTKIYQKGFTLGELVIRSARVQVSKPIPAKDQAENGAGMSGQGAC